MRMVEALAKQSARVFGPPPPKDAPKVESWMFGRRIYTRLLFFIVPLWILVALNHEPVWLWILFGISTAAWLRGFISGAPPATKPGLGKGAQNSSMWPSRTCPSAEAVVPCD